MEVILFFAGVFIGWLIQHLYKSISSREQKQLFKNMSSELRDIVISSEKENLTVGEMNQLIEERTIDKEAETYGISLPYIACPQCGSKEIKRSEAFDSKYDEIYYTVGCESCGWGDWTQ